MTRAWDSGTRSALGAVKRTSHKARGPSRIIPAFEVNAGNASWALHLSGRFWVGRQSLSAGLTLTTYGCFVDVGSCGSLPADATINDFAARTFDIDPTYENEFGDVDDHAPDPTLIGIYRYKSSETTSPRCWRYFQASDHNFAAGLRTPQDTNDPALYFLTLVSAAAEADRTTGVPACGTGYTPSDPPAGLVYRTVSTLPQCYQIFSRTAEGAAWSAIGGPWDMPSGWSSFTRQTVNQSRGEVWAKSAATVIKVWPIGTSYNDAVTGATVSTITIPAGNVNWWVGWGSRVTVVASTNGNLYVYDGTSLVGALPSPHVSADWIWAEVSYGWLVVTYADEVQFWRIDGGTVEHRQTIEGAYTTVGCVGEDHAVSGTWTRLSFNHRTGLWEDGGDMPHILEAYDDGWRWWGNVHRHIVLKLNVGAYDQYRLAQVF